MEELEKVPKKLKGTATLYVEQQYELSSTPELLTLAAYVSKDGLSRPSLQREAHWTFKLYMSQYMGTQGPRIWSRRVGEQGGGIVRGLWDDI